MYTIRLYAHTHRSHTHTQPFAQQTLTMRAHSLTPANTFMQQFLYNVHLPTHTYANVCPAFFRLIQFFSSVLCPLLFCFCLFITRFLGLARFDSLVVPLTLWSWFYFIVRIILWVFSLPSWYSFFSFISFRSPCFHITFLLKVLLYSHRICVFVYCTMHMCVCDRMRVIIPLMMGIHSF